MGSGGKVSEPRSVIVAAGVTESRRQTHDKQRTREKQRSALKHASQLLLLSCFFFFPLSFSFVRLLRVCSGEKEATIYYIEVCVF